MSNVVAPVTIQDWKTIPLFRPSVEDLKKAVREIGEVMGYDKPFPHQKILVKFIGETEVRVNSRQVRTIKEARLKFFESQLGNYCYTFNKRSGFPVSYLPLDKICGLTIFGEKTETEKEKELKTLLAKFHPNVWEDLQKSLREDPDKANSYPYENRSTLNISKNFPRYVIEDVKRAFEEKKPFHYKKYGDKRDLSIDIEVGADGSFRAWYSNEFAGCGNGSYYLLINPTTAAFRDDD